MHIEGLMLMLLVGVVAGWLAHMIAGGHGSLLGNLLIGLVGSVLGGLLAAYLGFEFTSVSGSILVSTCGAMVLLALFGAVRRSA